MSIRRSAAVLLSVSAVLTGCSESGTDSARRPEKSAMGSPSPSTSPTTSDVPSLDASSPRLRERAEEYLDALLSDVPCEEIWTMVVSDGSDKSGLCSELPSYRSEVRRLTLGPRTDLADDYAVFQVRVDYRDGSPPVLDSEVEVDVVDGQPFVFDGLP